MDKDTEAIHDNIMKIYAEVCDQMDALHDQMKALKALGVRLGTSPRVPDENTPRGIRVRGQDGDCTTWGYGDFIGIIKVSGEFVIETDRLGIDVYELCEIIED